MKDNILVLGHKNHGKDEVAKILCSLRDLNFTSSSDFLNKRIVFPVLSKKYGYKTLKECFDDRGNHRIEWADLIHEYCNPLDRITKEILSSMDIYVGMRNSKEYQASKHLYTMIIWVDGFSISNEIDESLTIEYNPDEMYLLDNNSTINSLRLKIQKMLYDYDFHIKQNYNKPFFNHTDQIRYF